MLNQEEIQFIQDHLKEDVTTLAFQKSKYPSLDLPKLLFQIQARQKLSNKLPKWTSNVNLYFPPQISLEQSSSEKTALFKSKLIQGKIIDLTGGMGVDSWAFAQENNNQVTYVEINEPLTQITTFNHQQLELTNVNHLHANGMEYIQKGANDFDWIYMDPARRDSIGKKVFLLKDCTPDATKILPFISKKTGLLIKVSPMLDIQLCINELQGVDEVHIVCLQNEIKELLFKKTENSTFHPAISIWDLHNDKPFIYQQTKELEQQAEIQTSPLLTYLYEPHAGILKAGFFKSIAQKGLFKIAANTHLYTSDIPIDNFPGKSFKVIHIGKLDSKWLASHLPDRKANICCRNFPLKPEEIRKKMSISDGGDYTLFAYRNKNNLAEIAICQKT